MKKFHRQLSELSNPMPTDFDPEAFIGDDISLDGTAASNSESENDLAVEHYLPVGKGKIRNELQLEMEDPKYRGKKVDRKEFDFGSESDAQELEINDDDDDFHFGSDDDHSDSEEDLDPQKLNVEVELKEMQREEQEMIKSLSHSAKNDLRKGTHLKNQMTIWDGLLDTRIRFQKIIETSNQLPPPETHTIFIQKDPEIQEKIRTASLKITSLLDQLCTMQERLMETNNNLKRKWEFESESPNLNMIWEDIKCLKNNMIPFRNQTIEKWHQKVQSTAGALSIQKKFKVINQSPLAQIQDSLKNDLDRLVKRSQIKRSDYKIIGLAEKIPEQAENQDHLSTHYKIIYDDNDFYQEMLKELVESRIADSDDPALLGMKWSSIKAQRKKNKKVVDTRASKGRKIRFNAHEKLENYMAPIPIGNWHDDMSEELFGSLFGLSISASKVGEAFKMNSMLDLFLNHDTQVNDLSRRIVSLLPNLMSQWMLTDQEVLDLTHVIADKAFLFRHLKKHEFQLDAAVASFISFLEWRHEIDAAAFAMEMLPSESIQKFKDGFCIITSGSDRKDRPILYIKMAQIQGLSSEELRTHLQFVMEMCRRLIFHLNEEESSNDSPPKVFQMSVLLDVDGFGFSNLNFEYLPCLREIFSNLFPQSFGSIYVLNYGWVHSGIWNAIKPLLTAETKDRLLFLTKNDLETYVSKENIPLAYGGTLQINIFLHESLSSYTFKFEDSLNIRKLYEEINFINSNLQDFEEEIWFDASENECNVKIKSAADLQLLLHASPSRHKCTSVPMSRTESSSRTLHYSRSCASNRALSPERQNETTGDKRKMVLLRIMTEISKAAHPGIGFAKGILISCFDLGRSLLKQRSVNNTGSQKGFIEKYWKRSITILTVVTLTIFMVRKIQKKIA